MGWIMTDIPDLTIDALAPEFNLLASTGTEIALANFRSKSKVYLFFVREYN
jgi:peroxiredoxin